MKMVESGTVCHLSQKNQSCLLYSMYVLAFTGNIFIWCVWAWPKRSPCCQKYTL